MIPLGEMGTSGKVGDRVSEATGGSHSSLKMAAFWTRGEVFLVDQVRRSMSERER